MVWSDYTIGAKRCLAGLWCWQWFDVILHIATHLVTVPHVLANVVWWVSLPIILNYMKPPDARRAILACNVLYWCFIIWFIVDFSSPLKPVEKATFYFLVTVSQLLAGFGQYYARRDQSQDDGSNGLAEKIVNLSNV